MPIECSKVIKKKTQKEFHILDEIVIKHAFDIHNEFGRFGDEKVYSNKLSKSLSDAGIKSEQEVCVKVSYKDFSKVYFLDLLVMEGIIYELKAVSALNEAHKQQLINYLLLTGLNHGQLINFGQTSVEKHFISTHLNFKLRKQYNVNLQNWDDSPVKSLILKGVLTETLNEWGAFLDYNLYNDAIIHFLGGKESVIKNVNVIDTNSTVGQQKFTLLNDTTAFHISGVPKGLLSYEKHIKRLLEHVELDVIQWVNFDKNSIIFKTIKKYK